MANVDRNIAARNKSDKHQNSRAQTSAVDCKHSVVHLPAQPGMPVRGTNISKGNIPSNLKANFP